jgi:carbonic anhydrase/acetyltransferase-like protein (isoleucine patch superfamily)
MPLYALGDNVPEIHESAFIHPDAVIIGSVRIGAEASIWPGAVLRGDEGEIIIGARTSIQDGSVLHCTVFNPTIVGDECVVGHIVHLEGCTIEDRALVGNGSVVLHNAIVRSGALVGSNAVVPNNMEVPAGAMALGVPAKIRPDSVHPDMIRLPMEAYVARGRQYLAEMRLLPPHGV